MKTIEHDRALVDAEDNARLAYDRWKSRGTIPWRLPFMGLFFLALISFFTFDRCWNSPYWWAPVAVDVFLLGGAVSLFVDIPRRRLGRLSRAVLWVGLVAPIVFMWGAALGRQLD